MRQTLLKAKRDKKQTMTSRKISTGAKREALAYICSDTMKEISLRKNVFLDKINRGVQGYIYMTDTSVITEQSHNYGIMIYKNN
jgi:hypothetical protein